MLEGLTPPSRSHGSCKVGVVAATLKPEDRKILLDAISNRQAWPVKTLSKALAEKGLRISDTPLYNHRAQTCACFRS